MSGRATNSSRLSDGEWLRQRYIVERASAYEIAAEIGSSHPTVRRALRRHGIAVRSLAEAQSTTYAKRILPKRRGLVPLRRRDGAVRGWAQVDDADYDALIELPWHLVRGGYAASGRVPEFLLHRHLLGLAPGDPRQGDHKNRNRLDNRRENLRVVPAPAQAQNTSGKQQASSRYRGVSWSASTGKWAARATLNRREHYLGVYVDEAEAAAVAAEWRRQHMPYAEEAAA